MTAPNHFNYLNLVGFLATTIICIRWNIEDGPPDEHIEVFTTFATSPRLEGIFTPAAFTFVLERAAFGLQCVFAMVQMMPKYNNLPLVQHGVFARYFLACVFEVLWVYMLNTEGEEERGRDRLTTSKAIVLPILMAVVLFFYSIIVYAQGVVRGRGSIEEYWLLQFPFVFGCGWSLVKFLITFNAPFADMEMQEDKHEDDNFSISPEIIVAIISLLVILAVSVFVIKYAKNISPEYCIPMILSFYLMGIARNLFSDEMMRRFEHNEHDEEGNTLIYFQVIAILTASLIFLGTVSHAYFFRSNIRWDEHDIEKQSSYEGATIKLDDSNDSLNSTGSSSQNEEKNLV